MKTEILSEPGRIQKILADRKRAGNRIVVVPTMGALHAGHRALIDEGRKQGDILVVTIFVNPTQFGPNEDLAKYPRTFEADTRMCEEAGADFIFAPDNSLMYPPFFATYVQVEGLGERLCGQSRPTHFRGVTTVVAKLFQITLADAAVFGWKDAQQLLIIRRMVQDLNMPVQIIGMETVREPDGLAMSSRNKYLSPGERKEAPVLHRALLGAKQAFDNNPDKSAQMLQEQIREQIGRESSGRIDYVEIAKMDDLSPLESVIPGNTLIALACYWGTTRLIDNIRL